MTTTDIAAITMTDITAMKEPEKGGMAAIAANKKRQFERFRLPLSFFIDLVYYFLNMKKEFISTSSIQTKKLGQTFAQELSGGEIICLSGDLGAGKTTFTQGLLKGLKIKGPYTSPTFAILKAYKLRKETTNFDVFHIDAYRVSAKDLLELGFKDFAGKENSITIIEWPENVKRVIPIGAVWINLEWLNDKERKIVIQKRKE